MGIYFILITGHYKPAAVQCGRFPEAGIHQTCKWRWERQETTSKTRTAAAGGTVGTRPKYLLTNKIIQVKKG
jgi:hypothetical protein